MVARILCAGECVCVCVRVCGTCDEREIASYYIVRMSVYHAWIFGYGAFMKITREHGKRMYVNKFIFEGVVVIWLTYTHKRTHEHLMLTVLLHSMFDKLPLHVIHNQRSWIFARLSTHRSELKSVDGFALDFCRCLLIPNMLLSCGWLLPMYTQPHEHTHTLTHFFEDFPSTRYHLQVVKKLMEIISRTRWLCIMIEREREPMLCRYSTVRHTKGIFQWMIF